MSDPWKHFGVAFAKMDEAFKHADAAFTAAFPDECKSIWRPIENAPRDGTFILVFLQWIWPNGRAGTLCDVVAFDQRVGRWVARTAPNYVQDYDDDTVAPTHWMPLPAPPAR
ncbi:DUF551 domain-containing protein [Alteraurantiacibacter buctensis]|uniref:DUF551 domain-containing protein n=1 Tax=Alteraurantiacibacter buctensis TaxID=1503981 RepID=A0A844Z2G7_9SPHN|nr:DUF551 domain-containing protein [Alteraurantiacibacter buctensis]MXO72884.1 hypothetical protein [Alteraurantiacibacter buctensis]